MFLLGLEDSAKAARAREMLAAQALAELAQGRKLSDEDIQYAKSVVQEAST